MLHYCAKLRTWLLAASITFHNWQSKNTSCEKMENVFYLITTIKAEFKMTKHDLSTYFHKNVVLK